MGETEQQIVTSFSSAMLAKIEERHNRYVPLGWKTMDMKRLISLLEAEVQELKEAVEKNSETDIRDESVDIANYAMFIHNQA
jgi:NTP pyrophosphatase (non-canonical NTP hydrolase)